MPLILIGIDDTDNEHSIGTGRLARNICILCSEQGLVPRSVTRHQFLVDPAIPYTSHNSGACVVIDSPAGLEAVKLVIDEVAQRSADGSDPGVCLAPQEVVTADVQDFGLRAAQVVLEIPQAFQVARQAGLRLYGLGGNCQGVIGAIGAVGQYSQGHHGRYIDLPGLRDLTGVVTADQIQQLGITLEHRGQNRYSNMADRYDTLNWVRPALKDGGPVWTVEWSEDEDAWIPVDRKKSRPLE